ncbi:MAG: BsaWI family type II restriction enzyme [Nitrososphaerales archaeon]
MKLNDLVKLYEKLKERHETDAYKHISQLLRDAKEIHKKDFMQSTTAKRAKKEGRAPDHEQSWRAFKGKNLEKLIMYIIKDEVESLGLKIFEGNTLERTNSTNLSKELSLVKRNLSVDYGEFGLHLPDVDLIIYEPSTCKVIAVISSKVTLRERIAQTGYWKFKLAGDEVTRHIKVFFITPAEDRTLTTRMPAKKGRAIVEKDTDGGYVMSEEPVEESNRVKMFDKFIDDLKNLLNSSRD